MSPLLVIGVLASAAWAAAGLALLHAEARAYGHRTLHAAPAGDPDAGVRYAFTGAMHPMAKESVREHLPSYVAGLAYHAGIFTALGLLAITLAECSLPGPLRVLVKVLLGLGTLGGAALLLKRLLKPELRGLSTPDDVLSNLLATAFVALALFGPSTPWLLSAMLLLLYVPLGKLRHSLFFFVARKQLGAFFGRRGVFPPGGSHVR
jgi:hypothetical protein